MDPRPTARWRALAALLRPDAGRWIALGLMVAAASGLALAGPLVVRQVVDRASEGTTAAEVARLAGLFLVIALTTQALAVIVVRFAAIAAWRTTNGLRIDLTAHVLALDHEFHRRHTPGELIQRVDGDVTSVSDFLIVVVPRALAAALTVAGIVGVLAVIDWRLAAGMAAYVVVSTAVIVRGRHRAVGESSAEMGANAQLYGGIEERLTAAEDLRALGAQDHVVWRFVEDSAVSLDSAVRRERAFLSMWWFVQSSLVAGWVLVLVSGAVLVSAGLITLGTAFVLYQYVLLVSRPMEDVVHQLETVQKANGAMLRVLGLLEIRPTIHDEGRTSPPPGALSVELTGVTFDYGDALPVLHDVDLTIDAGRSLGVVGRTGSGKTTLSRVVLRLVEPGTGQVHLGGVPVDEIPFAELRRRVAVVPQEVELFGGSVRDNVTLYDPAPSDDDVADALRAVGLDGLADAGLHRPIGDGGDGLSAGEAQLLALARVRLRNPDLVVLDEATARVDPATEARLDRATRELLRGRTAIVIAHRLSTLRRVDDIVVFDHGRIAEHDTRDRLAADRDSHFRRLLDLSLEDERTTSSPDTTRQTDATSPPDTCSEHSTSSALDATRQIATNSGAVTP